MNASLDILLLKVTIAPIFVGIVSLVALRYGQRIAGWLVALPANTGTILFILTLTEGAAFASSAALGALLGIISVSAFTIGYARSAVRFRWPICLGLAIAAFVASTLLLSHAPEIVDVTFSGRSSPSRSFSSCCRSGGNPCPRRPPRSGRSRSGC